MSATTTVAAAITLTAPKRLALRGFGEPRRNPCFMLNSFVDAAPGASSAAYPPH
jgi:hypothetical protein